MARKQTPCYPVSAVQEAAASAPGRFSLFLATSQYTEEVRDRGDALFSYVVLIVCPNVTIKNGLRELDQACGAIAGGDSA